MTHDRTQPRRPLRVLFALPGLHRVSRGAEVTFEAVARELARMDGFRVTAIGTGQPRPGEPYEYRRVPCVPRERFERLPSIPYLRGHYVWEELTFTPGLLRAFAPRDFDVTVTCSYPYANWALRSRRDARRRPRHVFVTQNGDWMVTARDWEFKHFGCDGLVCTNPEYYERHRDRYACALIPNGVDLGRFHPGPGDRARFGLPPDKPVVLIVAALIPGKRVTDGIRAVARLGDAGPHLMVAGDGELRDEAQALGRQLLGPRFHRGVFARDDMPHLYRAADLLLHMSLDEPFGNIYLEATATGLPVVAHDGPTPRWILGGTGLLVDATDEAAVADTVRRGLAGRDDAAAVQARRRAAEQRFGWPAVAAQYGDFFRRLVRGSHGDVARDPDAHAGAPDDARVPTERVCR